jgi:hypothetical protein
MDTTETERLIHGLVVGDPEVVSRITTRTPDLLVAAALLAPGGRCLLDTARETAGTPAGRRLVAVAAAWLDGDPDRALLLARDHLADDPDHLLVAAIAAALTDRRDA